MLIVYELFFRIEFLPDTAPILTEEAEVFGVEIRKSESVMDIDGILPSPPRLSSLWGTRQSGTITAEVSRPGHGRGERQQLHAIPYGWGRQYSTKNHL